MGRSIPAVVRQGTLCSISKENLTMAKKKGFMTPERKKKLRTLLRKKAAEELKKEQERKAEERLRVIAERCGTKADIDNASVDDLKKICQQYFDKWYKLEAEMFFLQRKVTEDDLALQEEHLSLQFVPFVKVLLADLLQIINGSILNVSLGSATLSNDTESFLGFTFLLLLQLLPM